MSCVSGVVVEQNRQPVPGTACYDDETNVIVVTTNDGERTYSGVRSHTSNSLMAWTTTAGFVQVRVYDERSARALSSTSRSVRSARAPKPCGCGR